MALAKADAAGATIAALKEIIFAYLDDAEVDWETVGKRALSGALVGSGARYAKAGWAIVKGWFS